jgi:hypothetical protein
MNNTCIDVNDTVSLDSLMRYVLPTVPALPNALGVDLLRDAYRELMMRSEMLSTIICLDTQKDVQDYEIKPPEGFVIHRVREVGYMDAWQSWQPSAHYWFPAYGVRFAMVGYDTIVLRDIPTYDEVGAYKLRAVVIPDECTTRIPREVSVAFGNGIGKGAAAEALSYPTRPWYNPQLSQNKRREFENSIRMAKNLQIDNRGAGNTDMRGRRWV